MLQGLLQGSDLGLIDFDVPVLGTLQVLDLGVRLFLVSVFEFLDLQIFRRLDLITLLVQ